MRELVSFLLHPFNWMVFTGLIVALLYFRKEYKNAVRVFLVYVVMLFVVATPPLPEFMMGRLESQYRPFDVQDFEAERALDDSSGIYVFVHAAGFTDAAGFPMTQRVENAALYRLVEGLRIHKALPGSVLVIANGTGRTTMELSEVYAETAYTLGADSVMQLGLAKNTLEEAKVCRDAVGEGTTVITVTSASHMRRAVYHMEAAGLEAVPAPCNFRLRRGSVRYLGNYVPNGTNAEMFAAALKEYVGLVVARLEREQLSN